MASLPSFGFARIDYTGVPETVPRCGDAIAKVERTDGDGNCAIHSVVGEYTARGSDFKRSMLMVDIEILVVNQPADIDRQAGGRASERASERICVHLYHVCIHSLNAWCDTQTNPKIV